MRAKKRIDIIVDIMSDKKIYRHFLYDNIIGKKEGDQLTIIDQIAEQQIDDEWVEQGLSADFIEYWKKHCDLRLGQALITYKEGIEGRVALFYVEEGNWIAKNYPEIASKVLFWGSMGKEGKGPFEWLSIDDMSTDHLKAILETQKDVHELYREVIEQELKQRT